MKYAILLVCALVFAFSAKAGDSITDLSAALEKAKAEKKLLFIEYGREACGNCQALKQYIKSHTLSIPKSQFVYADLDCDAPAVSKPFHAMFKVQGNTLPFVVITDSEGKQLASKTGYGTVLEYQKLLREAKKKAGPASGSSSRSSFDEAFEKGFKKTPVNP